MQRVVVVGVSGSGKSTVANTLAEQLKLPHIELDQLFHGPNWVRREEFEDDVTRLTEGQRWIVDGNYNTVRVMVWSRADTLVWLDLPRWLVMWQVVRRSVARWALRAELFNGNRERARTWLRATHPIRWAWAKHPEYRQTYAELLAQPWTQHLTVHRLSSRSDVRGFLESSSGV